MVSKSATADELEERLARWQLDYEVRMERANDYATNWEEDDD